MNTGHRTQDTGHRTQDTGQQGLKGNGRWLTYLLLCTVLLLFVFTGCEREITFPDLDENYIETVSNQEITDIIAKTEINTFSKSSKVKFITKTSGDFYYENLSNSREKLAVMRVYTRNEEHYSRLIMLKVNNELKSWVYSMSPSKENVDSKFTGEVFVYDIDGNLISEHSIENKEFITKFRISSNAGKWNFDSKPNAENTPDLEIHSINGDVDGGELDEVIIIMDNEMDDGEESSGGNAEPTLPDIGWDQGDGMPPGNSSSPTTNDNENEENESDTKINNELTNKCGKGVFTQLENGIFIEHPLKPEVTISNDDITKLNFSEAILKLFNDSDKTHYTIQNGSLTGANASTVGATTTMSDSYLQNATTLSIARTMIHELVHAGINALNSNIIEFNSFAFRVKLNKYAEDNGYTVGTQRFYHEFMAQYVEAMAYSLYEWDKDYGSGLGRNDATKPDDLLGWDYYYSMSFAGLYYKDSDGNLIETDSFKELVPDQLDRDKIKEIIKNEQDGNSSAKGNKCS